MRYALAAAEMNRQPPIEWAALLQRRIDGLRRHVQSPGQLALDLSGGGATDGNQAGNGEPCGQGWISRDKTCHKGQGAASPANRPNEAKRSKPKETILFPEPIVGPSGAKLTAYTWQWTLTEDVDHRGEPVEKRVSDWEKSIASVETGRNVVHQFQVDVDGETRTVSAESALKLMGFLSEGDRKAFGSLKSSARTVARLRMAQQELDQLEKRWQKDWDEVEALPRPPVKVGEWSEEPPGWPRAGYRRRTWRAGDVEVDQIWNQLGVDSDQDEAAHLFAQWKASEMEKRGWSYTGQRQTSMRRHIDYNRGDLAKRLARAEAKLMNQAQFDRAGKIDSLNARIDALKRRCSTGYGCGAACISLRKECRTSPSSSIGKQRLKRLLEIAAGGASKQRGIAPVKATEAGAMAAAITTQRGQAAGQLRGSRRQAAAEKAKAAEQAKTAEATEKQSLIAAERKRQEATAKAAGIKRPKVIVKLRRARPGGETGPDGHWYPGGAWMSEGSFVGAKPLKIGNGEAQVVSEEGNAKGNGQETRIIRNKRPSFPERPTKPKGQGLPRPKGLKKMAAKNDELFFGDDGYILYPRRKPSDKTPGLLGSLFEAAVTQRMSTDELNWATEQIKQQAYRSTDPERRQFFDDQMADIDRDIAFYGGTAGYGGPDGHRWTARLQLTGVDAERYIAGQRFMSASRLLSDASPARQRRYERYRDPRFEDWIIPEQGDHDQWVWGLNNVFRAVRIRRERMQSPRADSMLRIAFKANPLLARFDALRARCGRLNG